MVRKGGRNFVPTDGYDFGGRRRGSGRGRRRRGDRKRRRAARQTGAGPVGERPRRPRLHPGLRRKGQRGRHSACSACRCPSAIRPICCTFGDTTPTWCPAPDLMLEFGDRVGVLTPPDRKEEIRRHFGDTVKAAAEFSYVSLGIGMVLGVLLGLVPIPIPGVGHRDARHRRRTADRRSHSGQAAPYRSDALDHAVAGQHRAAKFRSCDVSCHRRRQCRAALCPHRSQNPDLRCCSSASPCC